MSKIDNNNKPFACTSEGCQMTFTNEDHLNIHQKKHDMVLNLGLSCKTNAFADQTPTPTRFIRNCEEVGLFQDLQNVNPFEETFRKAIEHNKNGVTHIPEPSNDDTLHTPHIFPHITDENAVEKLRRTTSDEATSKEFGISDVPTITINCSNSETKRNNEVIDLTEDEADNRPSTSKSLETSNSGSFDLLNYVGLTSVTSVWNNSTKAEVKEKIKVALQNKKNKTGPENNDKIKLKTDREKETDIPKKALALMVPTKPRKRSGSKIKLKSPDLLTIEANTSLNFYDKNLNDTEKRRAMNRVAQMRSRERKKIWLDHMENEISKLKNRNNELSVENQRLKEENVLLKTILLEHNNCSVTKSGRIPTIISIHETTKKLRLKQKKVVPIVPKSSQKITPSVKLNSAQNPEVSTLSPQKETATETTQLPSSGYVKRRRLNDEGTKLSKLVANPEANKTKSLKDSIVILLE